jgi:transposase
VLCTVNAFLPNLRSSSCRRAHEVRPVPVTSEPQRAVAALHRLRSSWLATRTARLNTVRGLLRDFGIVIPLGARHVVPAIGSLLEDPRRRRAQPAPVDPRRGVPSP